MKKWPILMMAFSLLAGSALLAQGSGKKSIAVEAFQSIGLSVPIKVIVTKGEHKVEMEGPAGQIADLNIEVSKGSLNIERKKDKRNWNGKGVVAYVSMPSIESLSVAGSGEIVTQDAFENQGDLSLSIGGSGTIEMAGSAKNIKVSIAGSGDVKASGLSGANSKVSIAGSGDVKIGETESLEVSIAGSGDVAYKGNPKVSKSIAGSGDVKKM